MRGAAKFLGISTTTGDRFWVYTWASLYAEMRENPSESF